MIHEWDELVAGEHLLADEGELLFRQAAPSLLAQDGTLSYLVFRPNESDARKLSVRRGSKITAAQAYRDHVERGRPSLGTLATEVAEVENLALRAIDDSDTAEDLPEAHAYIDFRPLAKRQTNTAADLLLRGALARGWVYRPT